MCAPSSWGARSTGRAALPLATQAPFGNCQQQPNPNPQLWTMRALMSALTAWVLDDVTPPESAVPRIADGTLVPPDQVRFPPIPANRYGGVERPATSTARVHDTLHVLDFGPLYRAQDSSGIITREPPLVRLGKLWRARDAGRCRRQRYRRHRVGVLASADRHLYGLESRAQGSLRERHVQSARELHPLRRDPRRAPRRRAIRGFRSRSAIRRRKATLRRSRRRPTASSPSAIFCPRTRSFWSSAPRRRGSGRGLEGALASSLLTVRA